MSNIRCQTEPVPSWSKTTSNPIYSDIVHKIRKSINDLLLRVTLDGLVQTAQNSGKTCDIYVFFHLRIGLKTNAFCLFLGV